MATKSNTSARAGRNSLSAILARMAAAIAAYGVAATREDRASFKLLPRKHPKAFGGMTAAIQLTVGDKVMPIPGREFYYRSHDDIDRAMDEKKAAAKTTTDRRAVAAKRKSLHADLTRDERRIARAIPKALRDEHRAAEAALTKASIGYDVARSAVLSYRPRTAADSLMLLEFVTSKLADDIVHDSADAVTIMRNVIPALKRGPQAVRS